MNKIIMTIFAIFVLFGCGEENSGRTSLPYPPDNNTGGSNDNNTVSIDNYITVLISSVSYIPKSDNISTYGFEPCNKDDFFQVYMADILGRADSNTSKTVYIDYTWGGTCYTPSSSRYFCSRIYLSDSDKCDYYNTKIHEVIFYTSYSQQDYDRAFFNYYADFLKNEPYTNLYEEPVQIKINN